MEKKRVHIVVNGIVQGVGFRYFTHRLGNSLGLGGWVMNLPDGRVETVAEGNTYSVGQFIQGIEKGPMSSRVDDMELEWEEYTGQFHGFAVRF